MLDKLNRILAKYSELIPDTGGVDKKIKRAWKRLRWEPEDAKELRARISTNIGLLNAFNAQLTRDDVVALVRHQEDKERQTILNWVTPIDYAPQQSDFLSCREAGTGQWFLDSTEFQQWLQTDKTLFCPGIPGAGKTIITAIVIDCLRTKYPKGTNVGVAYIYCNFKRNHDQKLSDLLLSILKQLAQDQLSMPDSVTLLYDQHKEQRTRPSVDEISRALHSVTALYSRAFIVVDAVDECQVNQGCRKSFLSEIFRLQSKCGVHIFATSRFIPEIQKEFEEATILEIRASDQDVRRYLDSHMSRLPKCVSRNSDLQEKINTAIVETVDGM